MNQSLLGICEELTFWFHLYKFFGEKSISKQIENVDLFAVKTNKLFSLHVLLTRTTNRGDGVGF